MTWIEPLSLETWMINVFSGNPDVFTAVAILFVCAMAGYLKMNTLSMFFMLGIFILMFSGFIGTNLLTLFSIIAGLLIGYLLSQILR